MRLGGDPLRRPLKVARGGRPRRWGEPVGFIGGSRDPISTSITMPFVTLIYRVAASRHSVSRPIKFGLAEIDDPILPTQLLPLASGRGMLMSHRTPSEANTRSTVPPSS